MTIPPSILIGSFVVTDCGCDVDMEDSVLLESSQDTVNLHCQRH
jgi:hypothetical protein